MRACRIALRPATAAALASAAPVATAQGTYLCTSSGRTWSSPGPCRDGATSQRIDRDKPNRDQCAEMRRILQGKRQRLDSMTPGERADFERFEATWRSRCLP